MNKQIFQIKKNLKNSNLNNQYLYTDSKTKFIYDTASLKRIVGMNNLLRNKIIEITKEKVTDGKKMAYIKVDNEMSGWTEVSENNLIRLYRLPKINGKLVDIEDTEYTFNSINYRDNISKLKDRIIKAYYIFYYQTKKYLIVGKLDGQAMTPVRIESFKKLIFPEEIISVSLSEGSSLYNSSNFNQKVSAVKKEGEYKVISYINGQKEARIEIGNKKYWIRTDSVLPDTQTFDHDLETLEVVDFVTYLFEKNKYYENKNKNMKNKFKNIRENIVYSNENDEVYIKSYLGDTHDN